MNPIQRDCRVEAGLYLFDIFIKRLNEINEKQHSVIIPFPVVFKGICSRFSISKRNCWDILKILHKWGIIEIIFGHGVRISKELNFIGGKNVK
jgi:hypothetical protein